MFPAKTSPENAATIEKLAARLSLMPMGETIPHLELSRAAPAYNGNGDRWLLSRARERVEKELGCCFESVRGVGLKRLSASEVPDVGLSTLRGIRRRANRGKKRLERVNSNSLSTSEQRRVTGMVAMLGAVSLLADGRKAQSIGAVADPVKPIPPQNILDLFKS